jgi:hypothetical protein
VASNVIRFELFWLKDLSPLSFSDPPVILFLGLSDTLALPTPIHKELPLKGPFNWSASAIKSFRLFHVFGTYI